MTVSVPTRATGVINALRTPRAAAFAGIAFALLYGAALILIRISIPEDLAADTSWLAANGQRVALALTLTPYSGIAFLWFIAVIRDRLGEREDKFFATVFLGSGLLFVALSFAGAALAGGLITSYAVKSDAIFDSGIYTYGSAVMRNILSVYAMRMAGVFMTSFAALAMRTQIIGRPWAVLSYLLAAILLVSISRSLWVMLIFPVWVFTISALFLITERRS